MNHTKGAFDCIISENRNAIFGFNLTMDQRKLKSSFILDCENPVETISKKKSRPDAKSQKKSNYIIDKKIVSKSENTKIFKCNKCGKSYLSYPALYTHTKLKHAKEGESILMPNEKMRGRPKKVKVLLLFIQINNGISKIDPTSFEYFKEDNRKGGPTEVIYGFEDIFNEVFPDGTIYYKDHNDHPLYEKLLDQHKKYTEEICTTNVGVDATKLEKVIRAGFKNIEEEEKALTGLSNKSFQSCDEVFAKYLAHVARRVCEEYYRVVLKFILEFRECANQNWEFLLEKQKKSGDPYIMIPNENKNRIEEYCITNNAEELPELCNTFILNHIRKKYCCYNNKEQIELLENFCGWLFINGYTCFKIALID